MRFSITVAALTAATLTEAAMPLFPQPFKFPLTNGFPAPSNKAIGKIEGHAGGALPNGALPTKVSDTAIATFQLIALNEIFEVAFFTELLKNVTNDVPGYKVANKKYVMRSLRRIRAQEELHTLGANGILASVGGKTISPCKYVFPVTDYLSAIALANTFTDVVLSVVPGAQQLFAEDGGQEPGLIPLVGSILAQEGEQTGWFRAEQGKPPSAAPFLTGGVAQFAMSAIKLFIVPGSCPFEPKIPFYPPMTVTNTAQAKNMNLDFEIEGTGVSASKMSIVYVNGQSSPVTEPISSVMTKGKMTTFKAKIPFAANGFAKGLTYALLVKGTGKYMTAADAAADGLYGPALIEIQ